MHYNESHCWNRTFFYYSDTNVTCRYDKSFSVLDLRIVVCQMSRCDLLHIFIITSYDKLRTRLLQGFRPIKSCVQVVIAS